MHCIDPTARSVYFDMEITSLKRKVSEEIVSKAQDIAKAGFPLYKAKPITKQLVAEAFENFKKYTKEKFTGEEYHLFVQIITEEISPAFSDQLKKQIEEALKPKK